MIVADCDLVLGNDITAPVAVNEYEKCGCGRVFDGEKIALVMDHFTPNKDIKAAEQVKKVREFRKRKARQRTSSMSVRSAWNTRCCRSEAWSPREIW